MKTAISKKFVSSALLLLSLGSSSVHAKLTKQQEYIAKIVVCAQKQNWEALRATYNKILDDEEMTLLQINYVLGRYAHCSGTHYAIPAMGELFKAVDNHNKGYHRGGVTKKERPNCPENRGSTTKRGRPRRREQDGLYWANIFSKQTIASPETRRKDWGIVKVAKDVVNGLYNATSGGQHPQFIEEEDLNEIKRIAENIETKQVTQSIALQGIRLVNFGVSVASGERFTMDAENAPFVILVATGEGFLQIEGCPRQKIGVGDIFSVPAGKKVEASGIDSKSTKPGVTNASFSFFTFYERAADALKRS